MHNTIIEYPALIYKSDKNNVFVANCIIKKLIGFGRTESDAIDNLQNILNTATGPCEEYFVKVKPLYSLN